MCSQTLKGMENTVFNVKFSSFVFLTSAPEVLFSIFQYLKVELMTLSVGDRDTHVGPISSNSAGSIECHS
jgi:hypothetical protein